MGDLVMMSKMMELADSGGSLLLILVFLSCLEAPERFAGDPGKVRRAGLRVSGEFHLLRHWRAPGIVWHRSMAGAQTPG